MNRLSCLPLLCMCAFAGLIPYHSCAALSAQSAQHPSPLTAQIDPAHGLFSLGSSDGSASLHGASIAAEVDRKWLRAADYPRPIITQQTAAGELGNARAWTVAYSGGGVKPDLIYRLRVYANAPFADLQVTVRNSSTHAITVQDIRSLEVTGANGIDLGGTEAEDRILSDSFSEDRPDMRILDLDGAVDGLHRGVGSQLVYNRKSGQSLFAGALTSDKFLSILCLHAAPGFPQRIAAYEVDSTGTTELTKDNSLQDARPEDRVELSVTVEPGHELSAERLLLSLGTDYHRQLETYGRLIRELHRARVSTPPPMGWWSWTAYYLSLTEEEALKNAEWLSANLKQLGYNFFHVDEGYSVARGDYLTPNFERFPGGMAKFDEKGAALGLVPAIWTSPFEVSDRSWVFWNHPEWLVRNAQDQPIRLGIPDKTPGGHLYVLDATHPGAQDYLRLTYSTMAKKWGMRSIKLDFMEDTCVEGRYYRSGATALEAQQIGLQVIRSAVGENVLLDKDGSVMLNPVGIVDTGRISRDTGHKFKTIKSVAPGIAARYYMNRNYFVADPDAFMVTEGKDDTHLTLDEAKVSIALSAVAGGMMEIGDPLPSLSSQPERFALIENQELLAMARTGKSSVPVDLMSYLPEDLQPSIFFLQKSERDSILTVFNWTENQREHNISAASLGLKAGGSYKVVDMWSGSLVETCRACVLNLRQGPHSVQMLKIAETISENGLSH